MKLILLIFFSLFTCQLIGQGILPNLVSSDHQWNETSYHQGDFFSRRFAFSSDSTNIDGHWYHELLISFDNTGNNWRSTGDFLRKSMSKFFHRENSEEYEIYDFSLVVGDTFTITETSRNPEIDLIVTEIDSVELLNGTMRKRLFLRCEDAFGGASVDVRVWVEGIGDLKGLLEVNRSCSTDQDRILLCFQTNGEVLHQNEEFETCWEFTNTEDLAGHGLKLFPNPANETIEISGHSGVIDYKLYSIEGKALLSGKTNRKIDVTSIKSGLYILKFSVDGNSFNSKVVKE